MNPTDSRELVARFQAGDVDAFAEIYRRYRDQVYGYAMRRFPQHADDITQDVFVKAFAALPRWRDEGKDLGAWLTVIAANTCHSRARLAYSNRVVLGDLPEDRADTGRGPAEAAEANFVRERVRAALDELTDEQRQAVTLYYLDGLSSVETARAMGRDWQRRQATTSLLFRARRALAAQLAGVADA